MTLPPRYVPFKLRRCERQHGNVCGSANDCVGHGRSLHFRRGYEDLDKCVQSDPIRYTSDTVECLYTLRYYDLRGHTIDIPQVEGGWVVCWLATA